MRDTSAIEEFAQALIRQNKIMLDKIGICINMTKLPSWSAYRDARDRLWGSGWFGRLWCKHLRPRLMPERQRRCQAEYQIAEMAHRVAFLTAVLEMGEQLGYM